ncbi:MAG TPA: NADH-quinone oxidoreductase subunit L, partial [Rhodanobacteraceae bacterium]
LHHLLLFYRDRPSAVVVAHKKFVVARLAEICLVAAAALLYQTWGSLAIADITDAAHAGPLPASAGIAATLIAIAVVLKSAQLPLHGWLIQVMEAPTPVSALLHAGVVNLGGYVLVRLGALISASLPAETVLVLFGSVTACVAGLVMLTRVTIKVRLAWSTCSQMGFMLMECGLGLYDLALLHLVAHGLYKAHAFLVSGETVVDSRKRRIIEHDTSRREIRWSSALVALALTAAIVAGSALAWRRALQADAVPAVALALIVFGLAPLLWNGSAGARVRLRALATVAVLAQLYFIWHSAMGHLFGVVPAATSGALAACAVLAMATLYVSQWLVWARPDAALIRRAYPWMYSGLHLDERFHRLVARFWPSQDAAAAMRARGADPWTALEPK